MPSAADLYTIVKNTSGVEKFFGYLGEHGTTLAANATLAIFGNLQESLRGNPRKIAGLEYDLQNGAGLPTAAGALTIISTPRPIVHDDTPAAALADASTTATGSVNSGASGTGLPAGTYQCAYSFLNAQGETLIGGRSATFTISGADTKYTVITLPSLPVGATSITLYVSNTNLPTGTLKKYKTGITDTTTSLTSASWQNGTKTFANADAVPAANNTKGTNSVGLDVDAATVAVIDPSWGQYNA